jgi:hypothetical protein
MIRNRTYYDITYKNKRLKTRLRHDLFQTSLDPCADDSLKLVAYILGITNLFHTIKHTCLNDLALSIKRISSSMPLNMRLRDTCTRLTPIHKLMSFAKSPFRISKYEPFSIPFESTKETLQKHLSTPSVFAERLSLLSLMETIFGSLTYSETSDTHDNVFSPTENYYGLWDIGRILDQHDPEFPSLLSMRLVLSDMGTELQQLVEQRDKLIHGQVDLEFVTKLVTIS